MNVEEMHREPTACAHCGDDTQPVEWVGPDVASGRATPLCIECWEDLHNANRCADTEIRVHEEYGA